MKISFNSNSSGPQEHEAGKREYPQESRQVIDLTEVDDGPPTQENSNSDSRVVVDLTVEYPPHNRVYIDLT